MVGAVGWLRRLAACGAGALVLGGLQLVATPAQAVVCTRVVAIGVAGSGEAGAPDGALGSVSQGVVDRMTAALPAAMRGQVQVVGLPYPAVAVPDGLVAAVTGQVRYVDSRDEGVSRLRAMLYARANACPKQRIVLVGYSQGADVVGTTLAALDPLDVLNGPINRQVRSQVVGVALVGDPRFNPLDQADLGTFAPTLKGMFATFAPPGGVKGVRAPLTDYLTKVTSYCNAGDPICSYNLANARKCLGSRPWTVLKIQATCPHLHYTDAPVPALAANTTKAGAKLARQVLKSLDPLTMTGGPLLDATAGHFYISYLGASGGTGGYTWSVVGLPAWLTLSPSLGQISGTAPAAAGDHTFSATVSDGRTSVSAVFSIHVGLAPPPPPVGRPDDWSQPDYDAGLTSNNVGETLLDPLTVRSVRRSGASGAGLVFAGDVYSMERSAAGSTTVSARSLTTGAQHWTVTVATGIDFAQTVAVGSGVYLYEATTIVPLRVTLLHALSVVDGRELWSTRLGTFGGRTALIGDRVVNSDSGGLRVLDVTTGTPLWSALPLPGTDEFAAAGNVIAWGGRSPNPAGGWTEELQAYALSDGHLLWKVPGPCGGTGSYGKIFADTTTAYAFNPCSGSLEAHDLGTGALRWEAAGVAPDRLAFGANGATLYAAVSEAVGVNPDGSAKIRTVVRRYDSGVQTWRAAITSPGDSIRPPVVANGVVYVGVGDSTSNTQATMALNATTGAKLWATDLITDFGNLLVSEGKLLAGSAVFVPA